MSRMTVNSCDRCSDEIALTIVRQYIQGTRSWRDGEFQPVIPYAGTMYKVIEMEQSNPNTCERSFFVEKLERVF